MFDAVTLTAVADELNEKILHGRVQEIVQLDALSFDFEMYTQHARQHLCLRSSPFQPPENQLKVRIGAGAIKSHE